MLIVLKLQSFRLVDKRDIFALCFEPSDAAAVSRQLSLVGDPGLGKRLAQMTEVAKARAFEYSFKGVYRIASDRIIARLQRNLTVLVPMS